MKASQGTGILKCGDGRHDQEVQSTLDEDEYYDVEVMSKIILWRPLKELEYHDSVMGSMIIKYSSVWVRMEYYNVKVMDKKQEIIWGSRDIKQVMQYPFKITQVLEEGKLFWTRCSPGRGGGNVVDG